jgi:hypothetical protein
MQIPVFFPLTPNHDKPTGSLSNRELMRRLCFTQGSPCGRFSPVEEERPELRKMISLLQGNEETI